MFYCPLEKVTVAMSWCIEDTEAAAHHTDFGTMLTILHETTLVNTRPAPNYRSSWFF
jgi:hypothetical protein